MDLSAAFDLVPPDILFKKIKIYGLSESFQEWIKSYMTGRNQSVWIDNVFSSFLPAEIGVPQGSILGPLIFLIFVNDLAYSLDCSLEQYADDTTLSATSQQVTTTSDILTENCSRLSNWMGENQFKLNASKTHVMTLGTDVKLSNPSNRVNVKMDGQVLKENIGQCETLLGCQIQSNSKWDSHINELKQKLKKRIAGLYKIRNIMPYNTLKIISKG